jgi:hypothetical protein
VRADPADLRGARVVQDSKVRDRGAVVFEPHVDGAGLDVVAIQLRVRAALLHHEHVHPQPQQGVERSRVELPEVCGPQDHPATVPIGCGLRGYRSGDATSAPTTAPTLARLNSSPVAGGRIWSGVMLRSLVKPTPTYKGV